MQYTLSRLPSATMPPTVPGQVQLSPVKRARPMKLEAGAEKKDYRKVMLTVAPSTPIWVFIQSVVPSHA